MPCRKHYAVALLLSIVTLLVTGAASAAILQKGSQILNLVSPLANNGDVAFRDLSIRKDDGSVTPFVLPANTVLIISKVAWNFTSKYNDPGLVQFNLGEYFRMRAQINNNYCSGSDSILPGVAATNMSARIFLEKVGDPDRNPIAGTLSMRLVCYTAPDN
jgi:hypothetical protein